MKLTILFDSPYWIGLIEYENAGMLYVSRYIFGSEPANEEVHEFVLYHLADLLKSMTVGVAVETSPIKRLSPKRVQREIRRELTQPGITSKSHEAMRLQIEQNKHLQSRHSREEREAEREHKRAIARAKAKARHRGR
ncbi:MAG: YjdF family protein [Chloroflexi bacterium]|nr:YjdF family protein [Chloroflexota bacterium]